MGNGDIDQLIDSFLVYIVAAVSGAVVRDGRPAHAAVSQQRHPVAGRRRRPESHPVGRDFTDSGGSPRAPLSAAVNPRGRGGGPGTEEFQKLATVYLFLLHLFAF